MTDFDDLSVVVLAGGRGTRLNGLYPDLPKPMVPVAGRPFLQWLTLWIAQHGPQHFIYSTGHHAERIEHWVTHADLPGLQCACSREDTPLGTGGGLLKSLPLCRDWVLVVNGDSLLLDGFNRLLALRNDPTLDGGLIGVHVADTTRYGSLVSDESHLLTAFREKVPGRGFINGGVCLFRTATLRALPFKGPCSLEYDVFPALLAAKSRLSVIAVADAPFIDIGTPQTLAAAEGFIRQHFTQSSERF